MEQTDKLVEARLAEGIEPDAIVQELKAHDEQVDAVLTTYVNGFVQRDEPGSKRHHSFRLSRH